MPPMTIPILGFSAVISPDSNAGTSKMFQKCIIACNRNSTVVRRARYEKPKGHEKKYIWNMVKYAKNTRGKYRIEGMVLRLITEYTSDNHTTDSTMNASSWSEKNSNKKNRVPIMIGTNTKLSTT